MPHNTSTFDIANALDLCHEGTERLEENGFGELDVAERMLTVIKLLTGTYDRLWFTDEEVGLMLHAADLAQERIAEIKETQNDY
jgi:hypothetical protein